MLLTPFPLTKAWFPYERNDRCNRDHMETIHSAIVTKNYYLGDRSRNDRRMYGFHMIATIAATVVRQSLRSGCDQMETRLKLPTKNIPQKYSPVKIIETIIAPET